jgi:Zn-dependent membrane protease YugP
LFILAIIFSLYAQIKVSSTFKKYSRVGTVARDSAVEATRRILDGAGLRYVGIERVRGNLTDHYDPRANVLRLSDGVYSSTSAAAIGVAAHEAGHAMQHADGYFPIKLRSALVPVTSFASKTAWIIIFAGFAITLFASAAPSYEFGYSIIMFGIALFSVTALFQLVTLPCEFNASKRAMRALRACGRYTDEELSYARQVLSAAALTYVAALFVTIMQILRLLAIFSRGNRRR